MNPENRKRLRVPQGTESVHLDDAYRHSRLLRMIEDLYTSWGYLPVLTPVFDYYDNYRHLMDREREEHSYRFPDRAGELLMLRSDITLFLARQMGLSLHSSSLPIRVYYADSIIRHQEEEDISSDEFFQSGAELIGLDGRDGDMEVLVLLQTLLESMRIPDWRMHIGSRSILDAVLEGRVDSRTAGNLLEIRDRDGLCGMMDKSGLRNAERRVDLLLFLGTCDEFSHNARDLVSALGDSPEISAIRRSVDILESLSSDLATVIPTEHVRIDLSEHGGQPYYTGFTVKAYAPGANSAIASGGRYDDLLGSFGTPAPAVGFSLMMRKIEPISSLAAELADESPISAARGGSFADRLSDAIRRRAHGERVAMSESGGARS